MTMMECNGRFLCHGVYVLRAILYPGNMARWWLVARLVWIIAGLTGPVRSASTAETMFQVGMRFLEVYLALNNIHVRPGMPASFCSVLIFFSDRSAQGTTVALAVEAEAACIWAYFPELGPYLRSWRTRCMTFAATDAWVGISLSTVTP